MKQPVKTFNGKIIGYIDEKPNGDIVGYNFYNKKVGTYDKRADVTRDFYGRIIYKGNMITSIISQNNT